MNSIILNLNLYDSEELEIALYDIVEDESCTTLILFGDKKTAESINCGNKKVCYLGFSPISISDVVSLCLLQDFDYFNCPNAKFSEYLSSDEYFVFHNHMYKHLLKYYQGSKDSEFIYSLKYLNKEIPNYRDGLSRECYDELYLNVKLDLLLIGVSNDSFYHCSDFHGDLWGQLNNKSINIELHKCINKLKNNAKAVKISKLLLKHMAFLKYNDEQSLLFYAALFLSKGLFYKKWHSSNVCYIYLLRAVEVSAIFYLLKRKYITHDRGRYRDRDTKKEINGAGPLLHALLDLGKLDEKILLSLLNLRNNSIHGHGFYFPDLERFDEFYQATTKLLKKIMTEDELSYLKDVRVALSV
ncbi:TPA: hypothetical protein ACGUTS_003009 [Vibrio vulnificus]|nr:hypothetical protein [Vibrio vulnificus]